MKQSTVFLWKQSLLALLAAALLTACGGPSGSSVRKGSLEVAVDESLRPLIEAEIEAFRFSSPEARITPHYVSEAEAIRLFFSDSCPLVAVGRPLTETELKAFKAEKRYTPKSTWFMNDALAVLAHPSRPDTAMTTETLARILKGEIRRWSELGASPTQAANDSILLVFDGAGSGTLRYLRDSLMNGAAPNARVFALDSTPALFDYVANHPNALGFAGFSWLSDDDSERAHALRQQVRQLAIANPGAGGKPVSLSEHALHKLSSSRPEDRYPLRRRVYLHNREPRAGLALGLSAYIAGQEGQRIVHKANLVPTTGLIRLVEVQEQPKPSVKP